MPFWLRYICDAEGIWFYSGPSRIFVPSRCGIKFDKETETFQTVEGVETDGEWILQHVRPKGDFFLNTMDSSLSFYYIDTKSSKNAGWERVEQEIEDLNGQVIGYMPVAFQHTGQEKIFYLSDVRAEKSNWNRVIHEGRAYYVNLDSAFLHIMKNYADCFAVDDCEVNRRSRIIGQDTSQ